MDWDLTPYFSGVEGEDFLGYFANLESSVDALREELAELVPLESAAPQLESAAPPQGVDVEPWRSGLVRYEEVATRHRHMMSFLYCMRAYDVGDDAVQRVTARAAQLSACMEKLVNELRRGVRNAGDSEIEALTEGELSSLAYFVGRLRLEGQQRMSTELEGLAADLGTDGISAWGRLYDRVAGKLVLNMEFPDGRREQVPMAQRRSLLGDSDRRVRKAAFDAGTEAWRSVADTMASALNHIAGTRLTLYGRRGVDHFLDVALHQAAISRKTLDAMTEAVERHAEIPRRVLRAKARGLGLQQISWYDLEAPFVDVADESRRIPWPEGVEMVRAAFGSQYPALATYFDEAIEKRWVEHSPRARKAPGAFCTSSPVIDQARVFMTYQGSRGDVSTLAHEIGHGYHAHVLKSQRPLARRYPMTLAESASTFAELLLSDGLLSSSQLSERERVTLLGEALGDASVFLLDIPTRFRFEKAVYERRAEGELSVEEFEQLMVGAQREVFGDALRVGGEDPMFWAGKLHFFITGVSFYNFPYTFGYLLSRGLRAMHIEEGESFLPRYEAFLAATGKGWAQDVVRETLGCDLESPEFWERSILSLVPQLEEMERYVLGRARKGGPT